MIVRVLVLTAAYPGPTEPRRAVFLENLHRALREHAGDEIELCVVAPRVHFADPAIELRDGVRVRRFRYPSGGRRLKEHERLPWFALAIWLVSALWCVLSEARRGGYHLLVCHWVLPCGPVGVVAGFVLALPVVLWAHGTDIRRFVGRSRLATWVARFAARRAVAVIAVSRELAATIRQELGVPPRRLRVTPMGVADAFSPGNAADERKRLGLDGSQRLLFVGDLTVAKGFDDLLDALARLDAESIDVELVVAGSGPLADRARAASRTRVLGEVAQEDLVAWYRAADLFVFPSHSEGAPVVVMEALACSLPVVATRVGGIPELVIDGAHGALIDPGDPGALAETVARLLRDTERRGEMREAIAATRADRSARARAREVWPLWRELAGAERR